MKLILSLASLMFTTALFGIDQYPTVEAAAFYDTHTEQQWSVALDTLQEHSFRGHERVLDIGCGSGKMAAHMAGCVPNGAVVGIDMSKGMISFANHYYAPLYNNLSFAEVDALNISYSKEFDLIVSFNSIHWILDHQKLLNNSYNALKPAGSILFTIPSKPSTKIAAIMEELKNKGTWKPYLVNYNHPRCKFTKEEYVQLLQSVPFTKMSVKEESFTYYFKTKRELADWLAAFTPMLLYIPSSLHEQFLADFVALYTKKFPVEKDGTIKFKQNELIIKATK